MHAELAALPPLWVVIAAAVGLVLVHVVAPALERLRGVPRSVWLSAAGGVAVAYVFVHLLPELAEGQERVREALAGNDAAHAFAERHVYLIALVGLVVFYGLDKLALRSRTERSGVGDDAAEEQEPEREGATSTGVFRVHMASFALYNLLIGYLLVRGVGPDAASVGLFAVAMALHFLVTDFGLAEHHKHQYDHAGRWLLAAALVAGVATGWGRELPEAVVAVLVAFVAGGVILNVLKEEVPSERRSRFWAFALGGASYAALLLLVG